MEYFSRSIVAFIGIGWNTFNPKSLNLCKNVENISFLEVMTSMPQPTLPYVNVTISFLSKICFWGPTHPTFSDDVTLFTLFFIEGFPKIFCKKSIEKSNINNCVVKISDNNQ